MRDAFISTLTKRAREDDRIFLLTADLGFSVLEKFAEQFPNRFLNVGIAEQNAVGVAAGLAMEGMNVYIYSIIPFVTMRCFEQVRVDIAYMNSNVKLVGVGAGYSYGPAGATHHAIEDIAIMRALPNMTVCCPGDPFETKRLISESFDHEGPMYFRLGKGKERVVPSIDPSVTLGKARRIRRGSKYALITTSNMLDYAEALLSQSDAEGEVELISVHTMKPFDGAFITSLLKSKRAVATLEEHNVIGGLGSAVAEIIADTGISIPFFRYGIRDEYTHAIGSQNFLRQKYIWDKNSSILNFFNRYGN